MVVKRKAPADRGKGAENMRETRSREGTELRVLEVIGGAIKNRGQDGFVRSLVLNLDREGLRIDCLVPYDCPFPEYKKSIEESGAGLYELGLPYMPERSVNYLYRPFLGFLREHPYDIIHVHSSKTTMMAMVATAAKKAGLPHVVIHAHNGGSRETIRHRLLRWLGDRSMRDRVELYCACSRSAAEWKFAGKYAERAVVIKNGIDAKRFRFDPAARKDIRDRLGIPPDVFVVGNTGSLTAQKNQTFLLQVFSAVAAEDPSAVLLLVGGGEDRDMLERIVEHLDLSDKVIFTGNVSDVESWLQAMDVFVFPSLFEGFGIAALEAQAAGLPVIASDNVPEEIAVTDHARFLSLEEDARKWAGEALKCRNAERRDHSDAVRQAGYDICETADFVKELYRKLEKGENRANSGSAGRDGE